MLECPVTVNAGKISIELLVLLNADRLEPGSMPNRLTGWFKRSFEENLCNSVLFNDAIKVMSFFGGRYNYILTIGNESTRVFTATRVNAEAADQSAGE